jgi:ATP-binding cassette subfamily F protein uup
MPQTIEQLEGKVDLLQQQINDPAFFEQDNQLSNATLLELADMQQRLESAYARWDELESLKTA